MGVVDFDPENWSRDSASERDGRAAKVAKPAKDAGAEAKLSQHSQLSQSEATPLPDTIGAGIAMLRVMRASRLIHADRWPLVVEDAVRLVREGWAVNALALGWTALDLFGAVTNPEGNPDADGLAVKLGGRKILAVSDAFATVKDQGGGRSYLYRGSTAGAVLLWNYLTPKNARDEGRQHDGGLQHG